MNKIYNRTIFLFFTTLSINTICIGQSIDEFKYAGQNNILEDELIKNNYQFNGYTNYWHDSYSDWYRYGNLFKMSTPNVKKSIQQSKVDIAEDMGL